MRTFERSKRGLASLWMVLAVGSAIAGCGGGDPNEGGPPKDGKAYYSQTVVRLNPDGTTSQWSNWITPEQQEQQKAARAGGGGARFKELADLTWDPGCDGASLWLYDQPNLQGSMLCLSGTGTADLSNFILRFECTVIPEWTCFPRFVTWQNNVRSVYPGAQEAWLGLREPHHPEHVQASSAAMFKPWTPYNWFFFIAQDAVELVP